MRPHLASLVDDFRRHGSKTAIVTHRGNRRLRSTYAQLAELSARFAAELDARGIQPGDRVVLWGENSVEWVAAFFGCVLRGVIAVPLDAAGSADFATRVIADVQPRMLTGDAALLNHLPTQTPARPFSSFAAALPAPDYTPAPALSRSTPLQIIFTSGTTAEPKGIVHTHGNVLASLDLLEREMQKYLRYLPFVGGLRILHTLPLSHVFGQFMGLWVPPLLATTVHYETRLQAPGLLRTIHDERISVLAAVPRVLDLLRLHLLSQISVLQARIAALRGRPVWQRWWRLRDLHRRFGLTFWAFVSGGAALPSELESFWTEAGFALVQGYGMTETTALVTLNHPFRTARGSIGRPLAGREVKVTPEGEVLVRGASIADTVWRNGKISARAEPGDDWLATGDLVTRDPRGELVFTGRKSSTIVTSAGLNIHPEDLEAALRHQPGVRDVAVVAYPSPMAPVPAAVLLLDPSSAPETVVSAANRELADFQQIRYWLVWPEPDLPRTSTGKVLRRRLEQWVEQALISGTSGSQSPTDDSLLSLLHEVAPGSREHDVSDETRLAEDLHLDSLALVQLQAAVEQRYGLALDDAAWEQVKTVGDLRVLIGATASSPSTTSLNTGSRTEPSPVAPRPRTQPAKNIYPRWPWSWPMRLLRVAFLELVVRPMVAILSAPRVDSQSRQALSEPALLIANHVTAMDVPLVLYALPARDRRRVAVAMSGEMLTGWRHRAAQRHRWIRLLTPVAYWLVTALFNVFPLPRGAGFRESFQHAGHALDRGYHVLVFPEGRRSEQGELQSFEPGVGLLAQQSHAAVQPIYLQGLDAIKQRRVRRFRPGTVVIRLGEPLRMQPSEDPAHFTQRLYTALKNLQPSTEHALD